MLKRKKLITLLSSAIIICSIIPGLSYAENSVVDDSAITLEVKSKLSAEHELPANKIHVKTQDGVVILTGTLESKKLACAAVETASSVKNIKDVDATGLQVLGSRQPLTDSYITSKVKGLYLKEKLFGDKPTAISDVTVETKNGVVYLSGKVDNQNLEQNAITLAKQINGVKDVVSVIKLD